MNSGAPHLGGWVPGGDPATWLPTVWQWTIDVLGVQSVLDVGCGDGLALDWYEAHGVRVQGIEGTPQANPKILQHDYTRGPALTNEDWDMVWCCEFVEHVEAEYMLNFLATFQCARFVLMTHAFPGQPGTHHVNCQPEDYWVRRMDDAGFDLDSYLTNEARRAAQGNTFSWDDADGTHVNHFLRSGLVFVRRP